MEGPAIFRLLGLGAAIGLLLASCPASHAAAIVDCAKRGQSLTKKLASKKKQLVLVVKGTCRENLVVSRDDVTIQTDGVNSARLEPADPSRETIRLDGARRILIDGGATSGLTVVGGSSGIAADRGSTFELKRAVVTGGSDVGVAVLHGSSGAIDACHVHDNTGSGIRVASATATITASTVEANGQSGVIVTTSGQATIGIDAEGKPSGNAIRNNARAGVTVVTGASATLAANTVEGNGGAGVAVGRATVTLVAQNVIASNSGRGIYVAQGTLAHTRSPHPHIPQVADQIHGNGAEGIDLNFGASGDVRDVIIAENRSYGIWVRINSTLNVENATISNNGTGGTNRDGIGLWAASTLHTWSSPEIYQHAGWGIYCADGSSHAGGDLSLVQGSVPGGNALGQTNCSPF